MRPSASLRIVTARPGVESRLRLFLAFTSVEIPYRLIASAQSLASGLDAAIDLLAVQVIPYPAPLVPDTRTRLLHDRLEHLARPAQIVLTRSIDDVLTQMLPPHSMVLVPAARWRFSRDAKFARRVARAGHEVIPCST